MEQIKLVEWIDKTVIVNGNIEGKLLHVDLDGFYIQQLQAHPHYRGLFPVTILFEWENVVSVQHRHIHKKFDKIVTETWEPEWAIE